MKLNTKQQLFCQYYVEEKGNWTTAYKRAYGTKNDQTAKVNASRMLTNANVIRKIREVMKEQWFNDVYVDVEMMKLIQQDKNLWIKLKAISEYNKLGRRYEQLSEDKPMIDNINIVISKE